MKNKLTFGVLLLLFIPLLLSAQTPLPVTPANAAIGVAINVGSVTWTAFDGGAGNGPYDVEIADASFAGPHSTIAVATSTGATSISIPGLLVPSTTYYWRVRDTDINGAGADGPWFTYSFTTVAYPTTQASNVTFTNVGTSQFDVSWTIGDGSARAVFVRAGSTGTAFPINGTTYSANTTFGNGTQISASGWFCVYNGVGTTVTVTGLTAGSTYRVMVTELNGAAGTEAYNTNTAVNNPMSQVTLPSVTTSPVLAGDVDTKAFSGGNVTAGASSVTARGVVWDTNPAPTTALGTKTTDGSGGGVFTSTVTPLVVGTKYYLRAYATNAAGTVYGAEIQFIPRAFSASANLTSNFQLGVTSLPTFSWSAVVGATSYDLEVSTSSTFGSLVTLTNSTAIAGTGYTVAYPEYLNNGTLYYWRVKVNGGADDTWYSSAWQFNTVNASKPVINPIVPGVTSAFVGWYPVPFSSGLTYDLYYSLSPTMSPLVGTISDLTVSNYTLNGLNNNATYYVQVRAKNTAGTVIISYSTIASFTTTTPPKPTISYPSGGVTVYASTPTFFWYIEGNEPSLDYEVEWQPLATPFTNVPQITTTANKLYKTLTTALTSGGSYHWQVRSKAGANTSAWSDPATFVMFSNLATVPPVPFPSWPAGSPTPTV